MHRLLEAQLKEARSASGELDIAKLLHAVDATYERAETERRGVARSMRHMADEAQALAQAARAESATQLRAVLDHIKDGIITADEAGRIATINATGQRVFGYSEQEAVSQPLTFLLPHLAAHAGLPETLDQLAARLEDTQIDLAPHETLARHASGSLFTAEVAVSKANVNHRTLYVVCFRDTTDRKNAEAALRDSEARYRTLVEHAPEIILVIDADTQRLVDVNENAARFFKTQREQLLANAPDDLSPPQQPDGSDSAAAHRLYVERTLSGEAPVVE